MCAPEPNQELNHVRIKPFPSGSHYVNLNFGKSGKNVFLKLSGKEP